MSKAKHTTEPWKKSKKQDGDIEIWAIGTPKIAMVLSRFVSYNEQEANARRILAAVNACKGIPIEALENGVVGELMEAAKGAAEFLRGLEKPGICMHDYGHAGKIEKAIAKIEA